MTQKDSKKIGKTLTQQLIEMALLEDRVLTDVTTNSLLEFDRIVNARVTAKEEGNISGTRVFCDTFKTVDSQTEINILKEDGSRVKPGDTVLEIRGKESSILKAERTALNFLQRLSGIASLTAKFVQQLDSTGTTLLDTRKTTPGMRLLEKKAVKDGGGSNHRMDLEDMAMIKDNHIKMAGSISRAVEQVKEHAPGKKIEVEVKNLEELAEALAKDVHIIMLDNFRNQLLDDAVEMKKGHPVKYEISGNVTLETIAAKAVPGIDYISVGALTHSFKSLDLSLNVIEDS